MYEVSNNGLAGGSGGGGGSGELTSSKTGGAGTSGEGSAGGASYANGATGDLAGGGGGGGKSSVGSNSDFANNKGGAGGAGITNTYKDGTSIGYGGGGGGAGYSATQNGTTQGGAATHGGGAGNAYARGFSGTHGTGGGGGGGNGLGYTEQNGGDGGSGIVVIRYPWDSANNFAASDVTLTFVAASYANGSLTIGMPAGAQAGDIVFVIDRLTGTGNIAAFRTPLTSSGNSFTAHQTTNAGSASTFMGCRISSRVLVAGELGTITNLINNVTTTSHRTIAVLFRPSTAITSTTYTSTGGESTTGNPAVQTVSVSSQPQAAVAMAVYTGQSAVDPRTSGISMNELVDSGVTTFYVKYKLYASGDTRTNFTVDMDDEGVANLLQSFYVKFN
jgi:hypothetical protein